MATNDIHLHTKEEGCAMCGGHVGCGGLCRQHHWMHVVIKIVVAIFIFWCGVQFGELKSILHANYGGYDASYGYGMTGSYGERNQGYYGSPVMMGGWTYTTAAPTPTPVPTTTTTKPK